jgi:phage protein D
MSAFTPLAEVALSRGYGDMFAPAFEIRVEGVGLPHDVVRDVVEVTYTDSLTEIDRFDVTVSNWDDDKRQFKFHGSESEADAADPSASRHPFTIFEPSAKTAELYLGYAGKLRQMMRGRFATVEPIFPSSGKPTLTASALNVLQRLRRKPYSSAWPNKKPSEIATGIAGLRDGNAKRFPLPVDVDPGAGSNEDPIPYIAQAAQHDIDFLLNLARQYGYEVELRLKEKPDGTTEERLWFGRPARAPEPVDISLRWGATLVDFKPALTTANQIKSVTVRGWDRNRQKPIEEKIAFDSPKLKAQNPDLAKVIERIEPREDIVVDLPVASSAEAKERAIAIMRDRNANMIKARGTTIGMPDLRAGRRIEITGLGGRFSGQYLLTKTDHTLGEGGYLTRFECRREHFPAGVS